MNSIASEECIYRILIRFKVNSLRSVIDSVNLQTISEF